MRKYLDKSFLDNFVLLLDFYEFRAKSIRTMNVKKKFTLLKDVKPGGFYGILGEVIRVYGENSDSATVYLSDYTANSQLYNYE